ncbi:UDP-N-acetylmuramoyl-L-alanyl-D-glutamate--2,6-diaminopimelate ligase [Pseudactinotalea sp. Z1748]|uniref:UDP-N-acetylmuramoyl-L-alanyl-D-glutamate--2, 6-diaminopimelate ligase n=1 Tax=Pseudactinotalea sp. Z1748 TaxID=3413027 RepID=UPI003C7A01F9
MNVASAEPPRRSLAGLAAAFGLTARGGPEDGSGLEVAVTGVSLDNRLTGPGELFAALPGARAHGARFAAAAVAGGAVGVLTDAAGADLLTGQEIAVPVLVAQDPRAVLGQVASWIYGHPSRRLGTYAVTGTNGKTTTTYFLEHILAALGRSTGLIGTVELKIGAERTPARLTTPEAPALHQLLAQMVRSQVDDVVMEVSSHALELHRVDGVVYEVAGFTNLTQDHLDFHGDMESYFAAKAALFTPGRARRGVVLVDDEWGRRLAARAEIDVVTVSATQAPAHWQISAAAPGPAGTPITLSSADGAQLSTTVALPGTFNVANAAVALVMALQVGASPEQITAALPEGLTAVVPGRMELVATAPRVLVDFAHNTEAIQQALAAVRQGTQGRLFVIFGATGDRDRGKRASMGAAAVQGADVVVITDDDPHDEDPAGIRAEVMAGAVRALATEQQEGRQVDLYEVAPRQAAIARVIRFAADADTVLVAGRGHETWQEIAGVDHHLDDRQEVRKAMAEREQHPTGS